jgi:RecA-family ATPase
MMVTASDLARLLGAKRSGAGWAAKCPAHDDHRESLSFRDGDDGRLLAHCFAGCDFADILAAAGIEPAKPNGHDHAAKPNGETRKPRVVATYDYQDPAGELLFQVLRHAPKDFRQRQPDGNGGWLWNTRGVEVVPYKLPAILDASEVFICEGEKDADRLAALGIVATTAPGGAGKWPKVFAGWFEGRHVVILPDNDEPGRAHASDVATKLHGAAASIRVLALPGLPLKGDVSDWLDQGHTAAELHELAAAAPYWSPDDKVDGAPSLLDQIKAQVIDWPALTGRKAPPRHFVLPDWLPAKCVTLLHGFGGVGKTLLAQQIGTACILQCQFLGGIADACPVLGWFGEDDHDEIWRRQESINAALGIDNIADLEGKLFWRACPGDDVSLFKASSESDFQITPLFDMLRAQIVETGAKLTILDSATQIAAVSEINRVLVTRCIQALNGLCLETDTSIILIGHNSRTGDSSGSTAWENRVRSRLHMKREKGEDGAETIKLCRPKANYAATEDGVSLEWHQGAYRCTDQRFETYESSIDRKCREREVEQAFLAALDQLTAQRRATSASKQASNYAPKIMVVAGLVNGYSRRDLDAAMERLFAAGEIVADAQLWQRSDRHWATGLGRK